MTEINIDPFYFNKKVVVAGATGTIGIPITSQLIGRGAEVLCVSNHSKVHAERVLHPKANFLSADLLDPEVCKDVVSGADYVLNLVGIKGSVGIGETKVASYLVPMLRSQTNLMEAAFNEGVNRFLFVGSVCSYPQNDIHFEDNMWNGMPKQNDRIPGIAKRVGELLGEAYLLEHGWDAVRIVRPSNVYGPHDDFNPKTAQVIPSLISRISNGENPLEVWGDGAAERDFIFSEDVAFWMLEALKKSPAMLPINLGSGVAITIKEIVSTLVDIINPNVTVRWDPDKPSGDRKRLLSMDRAKKEINYFNRTPLRAGLEKTVEWYRSNILSGD